jgi:hypothetical protein
MKRIVIVILVSIFICGILYGQQSSKAKMLTDSSDIVLIGIVTNENHLIFPYNRLAFDGTVTQVGVERDLKGGIQNTMIEIYLPLYGRTYRSDGITLDELHRYILFLDSTSVEDSVKQRHHLEGKVYFSINHDEDMDYESGQALLREVEEYLGLPHLSFGKINILSHLSSFILKVEGIINVGGIRPHDFADEVIAHLNNARNYLQSGDSLEACTELVRFENKVDGGFGRMDSTRFVDIEWYDSLWSNSHVIRSFLPYVGKSHTIPHINSLMPDSIVVGSSNQSLSVRGEQFSNGAIIYWNWKPLETRYVSSNELQAAIPTAFLSNAGTGGIAVINLDGGTSNKLSINLLSPPSGCSVTLVNSTGSKLTGGALQYYEGSWKDAVNNNDGTFFVNTTATTISLRMTYEYGTQTKSNVTVGPDTVVFQTVNAQIQLQDSRGSLIDTGTVQYYGGAWRSLGTTISGVASKELLPGSYSFRMTYAYASKDKQQDIGTNPTVVFQTVNAVVQLQNSQGSLIDQGTVQYYSGAWRDFGATTNGAASKELLPNNYSFRMTYAFASKDKQQDIGANPTVVFQTVSGSVQLQNSQGSLIEQGTVQYYSGAWRDFGVTTNGVAAKELLPNNYSFRMTYAYASKDKQQDIGTNPTVVFQTVNAQVQLQNSQGTLMPAPLGDQGTVQYYAGAWRDFGVTTGGVTAKELLPNTYSFRMTYAYASKDKQQDIGANPTVVFQTVNATVQLQNSEGNPIDQGTVQYYAGAWRDFGVTASGVVTKELLPNNYSLRMTYEYVSLDKTQDLSTNSTVSYSTVLCMIRVKNSQSQPVDGATASYYSGAWRQIGATVNGEVTKELLPANLTFRVSYGTTQQDKTQNLSTSNVVEFTIGP